MSSSTSNKLDPYEKDNYNHYPAFVIGEIAYVYPRNAQEKKLARAQKIHLQQAALPETVLKKFHIQISRKTSEGIDQDPELPLIDKDGKIPDWHYPPTNEKSSGWRPCKKTLDKILSELKQFPGIVKELEGCLRAKHQLVHHGLDRQQVIIRNARKMLQHDPSSSSCYQIGSLFTNGFCLLEHESGISNWNNDDQVTTSLYPELEDICKTIIPEATFTFANSFIRRQSRNKNDENEIRSLFQDSATGRSPAPIVHNDFTTSYKEALIRSVETGIPHTQCFGFEEAIRSRFHSNLEEFIQLMKDSRILVINTWRSTTPGHLERDPICVCDRRTIPSSSVHVTTGTRREDTGKVPYTGPLPTLPALPPVPSLQSDCLRAGKKGGGVNSIPSGQPGGGLDTYFAMHDPSHQWYYFPGMRSTELLLWMGFDSDECNHESDLAGATLHTSFAPPNLPLGAAHRSSIDVRVLCILPKKIGHDHEIISNPKDKDDIKHRIATPAKNITSKL